MINIIPNYHPILVHFPIALITVSVVTLFLCLIMRDTFKWKNELLVVSRWTLWIAIFSSIFTLIAGFDAYYSVAHDNPSHEIMTIHKNWGITTAVLLFLVMIWSISLYIKKKKPSWLFGVGMLIVFTSVMATGWFGGEIVYRYGVGVMSLPSTNGEGKGHEHSPEANHEESSK